MGHKKQLAKVSPRPIKGKQNPEISAAGQSKRGAPERKGKERKERGFPGPALECAQTCTDRTPTDKHGRRHTLDVHKGAYRLHRFGWPTTTQKRQIPRITKDPRDSRTIHIQISDLTRLDQAVLSPLRVSIKGKNAAGTGGNHHHRWRRLLVLMALELQLLFTLVLGHFLSALLLDGTHGFFSLLGI